MTNRSSATVRVALIALAFVTLPFMLTACAKQTPSVIAPEKIDEAFKITPIKVQPSADKVEDSFSVGEPRAKNKPRANEMSMTLELQGSALPPDSLQVDKYKVSIQRAALEKEFLLQAALIPQPGAAMGKGLKSRVVAFRERHGKLYLLEATPGHVVTNDLPATLLLAEFPVIAATEETITFDFNAGMAPLFNFGEWQASDFTGPAYDAAKQYTTAKVNRSYLESATLTAQNQLVLKQIAQLMYPLPTGGEVMSPVEVRYYLTPYRPSPDYKPFAWGTDFTRFGFFQIAPQLTLASSSVVYATRFHPQKQIVFAVSANTPPEFRQAVIDGILYWNRAFGREVVKVVDAPAGVTAPDFSYNVVQWVPFDRAGFAYADAQADPRTGEILHAQVFFTSAFAFGGKMKARAVGRLMKNQDKPGANLPRGMNVALRGFEQDAMCDFHFNHDLAQSLTKLLAQPNVTDAMVLKAAQDYIREVSAHEIGHTLGIRHNFAGSIHQNFPLSRRDELVNEYFTKLAAPAGVVTSSSVMEYQRFEESIISGDGMTKGTKALDYDAKAIATLYLDQKFKNDEVPLYCTDSSRGKQLDCEVFDIGASVVESALWQLQEDLKQLPINLLESYIAAKTPIDGEPMTPFENIALPNPAAVAQKILTPRVAVLNQLTSAGALVKIHRLFPVIGAFNEDLVRKEHFNYITGQVERFGGIEALLAPVPAGYAAQAMSKLNQLLEKETYRGGTGAGERGYQLTPEEIETIRKNAAIYFQKLETEFVRQELTLLAPVDKGPKFLDEAINDKLVTGLAARMRQIIFATTGETIVADIEVPNTDPTPGAPKTVSRTVKLPKYLYPVELRVKAAGLLKGARGEALEWGVAEKAGMQSELLAQSETALSVGIERVRIDKLPKSVVRWVVENRAVLGGF